MKYINQPDNVANEISKIGNNINQVVRRINRDDRYDKEDEILLREKLDEIWLVVRKVYLKMMELKEERNHGLKY